MVKKGDKRFLSFLGFGGGLPDQLERGGAAIFSPVKSFQNFPGHRSGGGSAMPSVFDHGHHGDLGLAGRSETGKPGVVLEVRRGRFTAPFLPLNNLGCACLAGYVESHDARPSAGSAR